jgi:hypothetical protein
MTLLVPPRTTARSPRPAPVDWSHCLIVQGVTARPVPAEGWELRPCSACDAEVWLSSSGQRLLTADPELAVVCVDCATVALDRPRRRGRRQGARR